MKHQLDRRSTVLHTSQCSKTWATDLHTLGSLAIRAAPAGVNMTFKILYNDAVAMTGGQTLDGGMTVSMILRQVLAEGVEKVVVVTDEPHKYPAGFIPHGVPVYDRRDLQKVQTELREVPGVSVLIYDQTCAAEKRRRRKRGTFPDPDRRIFINELVCGCGDCGEVERVRCAARTESAPSAPSDHLPETRFLPQRLCPSSLR